MTDLTNTKEAKKIVVRLRTKTLPQSAYNQQDVMGALQGVPFKEKVYDWGDPNPDWRTWEDFLEIEFATALQEIKVPWPDIWQQQVVLNLKKRTLQMAISFPGHFVVGDIIW